MKPAEIVREWVRCFNKEDVDSLMDLYAENCVNHQVPKGTFSGVDTIRSMFEEEFEQFEMVCISENLFEDGEWAILEWKDPKGLRGCGFFHVVEGKIIFQRGYWDKLSFISEQR